ncbi:AMP-binding protein [Salipiger abyssi]|uniref:2-furoate---CoA ligase n=1 Tax=Salipiger abyssi TaxID=1250539 RepID=A0A1P8UXB2_9RHOB|nr:AMP-binding protein [Salipiger abyssi]APZ54030.1 2-furoate---CoA ligase [Salipiger abyssi]
MFDLATSFLASVERDPARIAIVDGGTRLSYADWAGRIGALTAWLAEQGVGKGDHVVTALQNSWEAATLHWACQFAGAIVTPINWRATAEELGYVLGDSAAKLLLCEPVSSEVSQEAASAAGIACFDIEALGIADLPTVALPKPVIGPEDYSLMLYTSGTTGKPKGVPRRHRAERAAAVAHVAQNTYRQGEVTLGVMPLYHTMGVRSLLAMSLIGGTFICLRRFDVAEALRLIAAEKVSCLYLVPTLYHAMLDAPELAQTDISSVRLLGFAGASMSDGLLKRLQETFQPDLFVNHYGSSEVYTFTIHQNAPSKPGSAGRAALNQRIRIVDPAAKDPEALCPQGEEGEIIADLAGDEAFEGYWKRPDGDAKSLHGGWYFTGDMGRFDEDGDLFVTGRTDDMIITGGENVSPVEVESYISLLDGIGDVAVVGLPDERWGQVVALFVVPTPGITAEKIKAYCHAGLPAHKRPRRITFVTELPKSPVGKLLRRLLIAGEYTETTPDAETQAV